MTDCFNFLEPVTIPDGLTYVVPEGVTNEYIFAAILFLQGISDPIDKMAAFYDMFTDREHSHFIDFKEAYMDEPNARITYYSEAKGAWVYDDSVFAAAGNFFYGFIGTLGGILPEALLGAAALLQEGDEGGLPADAAEDAPHVALGMSLAQSYMWQNRHILTLGGCGS